MAVAYSGGRDSTALLHATAVAAAALQRQGLNLQVLGLHVHHGLSPHADAWLRHCEQQCAGWAGQGLPVALRHRGLSGAPAAGESVEAWARAGRYAALTEMAAEAGAEMLLLAHHRRDQAETWLLQALRGAGVAGLAGMPREQRREGLLWARPWLQQPRSSIEAYVRAHGLDHVEDESNEDMRYARNRLRRQFWPQLEAAFPHAEQGLAQAAAWSQQALNLAQEIAAEDLAHWSVDGALEQRSLHELSPARASNLLRAWLQGVLGAPAPASLVERLLLQAPRATLGQWPAPKARISLYRGYLRVEALAEPAMHVPAQPCVLDLSRGGRHECAGWSGALLLRAVQAGGVAAELLSRVELRERQGGEQFQAHPRGMPRSLKKAWQSAGVGATRRAGPLLFVGERLLFVPGLGLDARMLASPSQAQFSITWQAAC